MHWRRKWQPTRVFLPGESQGRGSLVGCHLWGCTESDTTERFHFHFSLSCIGEGNGNPLECSCLENPRDGGAWWAAVYGVAQSQTRLKRLSSSSSFILSGVISPLISSSILGTYRPGEFIFHCPIFLRFHTVHVVLKLRILKWFAMPLSSGPHSVRRLHHDLPVLGCPMGMV